MLKKILFSLCLALGTLAFTGADANAQCPPGDVFINHVTTAGCPIDVTIQFGFPPCNIMGAVGPITLAPGPNCITIPGGMVPLIYTFTDLGSGSTSTITDPGCGPNQVALHMDCAAMCNMFQWHQPWHIDILPD